jgi:hypothetical protein
MSSLKSTREKYWGGKMISKESKEINESKMKVKETIKKKNVKKVMIVKENKKKVKRK